MKIVESFVVAIVSISEHCVGAEDQITTTLTPTTTEEATTTPPPEDLTTTTTEELPTSLDSAASASIVGASILALLGIGVMNN